MKKTLALLLLAALPALAQVQMLDSTTPHTNNVVTKAFITIPGICTNAPYTVTNYIYITYGDAVPSPGWSKLNSNLNYITNQLMLALQLPTQINSNLVASISVQSNRINVVTANLATTSNLLITTMATVASLPGGNIQSGTVNSNKLDAATMSWLNNIGVNQILNGANLQTSTVNSNSFDANTTTWLSSLGTGGGGVTLPDNLVKTSSRYTSLFTNFAYWSGSNYLGTVSNLYNWKGWRRR